VPTFPEYSELKFEAYDYILGDKIFTEASPEAEKAYDTVVVWMAIQQE
jgi:hypothetical protein